MAGRPPRASRRTGLNVMAEDFPGVDRSGHDAHDPGDDRRAAAPTVVIDYGLGNLGSIMNMLRKLGHPATTTSSADGILSAARLILPGVGAFDRGMANLEKLAIIDALRRRVLDDGIPVLGICLGAQLMMQSSDEGQRSGLAWIPGKTVRFFGNGEHDLPVPSMGWHELRVTREHPLLAPMFEDPRFYFVHSYHFTLGDAGDALAFSTYGYEFASAFARRNVLGVQFHPEKSHKFGMRLLDNFCSLTAQSFAAAPHTGN